MVATSREKSSLHQEGEIPYLIHSRSISQYGAEYWSHSHLRLALVKSEGERIQRKIRSRRGTVGSGSLTFRRLCESAIVADDVEKAHRHVWFSTSTESAAAFRSSSGTARRWICSTSATRSATATTTSTIHDAICKWNCEFVHPATTAAAAVKVS
jgi:hypothetical protein